MSDSSINSDELRRSPELLSDSGSPRDPAPASQRAASRYLHQLSHLLAGSAEVSPPPWRSSQCDRHLLTVRIEGRLEKRKVSNRV